MPFHFTTLDTRRHDRASFQSGAPVLNAYLQQQAGQHQRDGIATTHVLIDEAEPSRILGFCSLAAAQLHSQQLQSIDRKSLPRYPVPAVRVARLAVAEDVQGRGHGHLLLGHAVNCSLSLRETLGVRVIVVDAKNESAANFYRGFGFSETGDGSRTLYLQLGKS